MKPGKVVLVLAGRYSGRKAVIVKVSAGLGGSCSAALAVGPGRPRRCPGRSWRKAGSPQRSRRRCVERCLRRPCLCSVARLDAAQLGAVVTGWLSGGVGCVSEHRRWHIRPALQPCLGGRHRSLPAESDSGDGQEEDSKEV